VASGWAPVGAHQIDIALEPGEQRDLVFVLGYVENDPGDKWAAPGIADKTRAHALLDRFSTSEAVDAALDDLRTYWNNLLSTVSVSTNDPRLDRMINIWNPYQCMVTFNMSRSASYFESGLGRGMGFRDSAQDLLGFVHLIPERARERILDVAATQLPDGSAYHQYQPLTKRGNDAVGTGFNDDPLWLIEGTAAYVRESGDLSILDESVPFDNNPNDGASLFEHLSRSFQHVLDHLGPHGLPLIGRADWNDCLNLNAFSTEPGESFQTMETQDGRTAESVFIAGLFVHAGEQYADLAEAHGRSDLATAARERTAAMADTVLAHGWDGDWFLRAYDHFGNPVGSNKNTEGQIFIESQGMCVMAGIGAETSHADRSLDAVNTRLNSDHGILLHQPAFTRFHPELGEITTYPPGYKENGSVFCHSNPWVMIAATRLGRAEEAYEYWKKIAPAFREEIAELHRTEPYVYAQTIAGRDAPRHGEAKNSWLTGTAAWNWVAITQHIIGVRPEIRGLRVEPCLPQVLSEVHFVRHCRGAEYRVNIINSSGDDPPKLTVDGAGHDGTLVPYAAPGSVVTIDVVT
jgi:cellobiose phosphorylase